MDYYFQFCSSYFGALAMCGQNVTAALHQECSVEAISATLATDLDRLRLPYRTSNITTCAGKYNH